jgi:hypothetical protein
MARHALLFVVAFAGSAAFLLTTPGGIPAAQGCSGAAPWHYEAHGWTSASWSVDPNGVPLDGAVRLAVQADYGNYNQPGPADSGLGPSLTITVRGPDQALVPGAPETVPAPEPKTVPAGQAVDPITIVTWQPSSPFLPASAYTVHVEGLLGGPVALTFTTGTAAFQPPRPLMTNPSLSASQSHYSGPDICCTTGDSASCYHTHCAKQMIQPAPSIGAQLDVDEPVAAAKTFFTTELQVSVNGAPFQTTPESTVELEGATGTICIRAVATNTLTHATALTPEWCAHTDTLELGSSPNCSAMEQVLLACGFGTGYESKHYEPLTADEVKSYQDVCGTPGAPDAGAAGADGDAKAGAAGNAADASQDQATTEGGACAIAHAPSSRGVGIAGAVLGLAALLRRRRQT